jgi:hypothetical protein
MLQARGGVGKEPRPGVTIADAVIGGERQRDRR